MFTGIIETTGAIREVRAGQQSILLGVAPDSRPFEVAVGGSVCVDGACLTLESKSSDVLYFTAVAETLSRTTLAAKRPGDKVNMERSLMLSGRLDGHFVLGHIDAVGTIVSDRRAGDSVVRTLRIPKSIAGFCAEKGSIAVDGISLTIARAAGNELDVSLIPFTLEKTTMARKRPGDGLNIECDIIARYISRLLEAGAIGRTARGGSGGTLFDTLERAGF